MVYGFRMAVLTLPGIADDDALERAVGVKRSLATMEADQYLYLLEFLDERAADPVEVRMSGAERVHPYGGDGTPDIPEFAVCEVAAALGLANRTASRLVADMLDLRHRLPLLFQCLRHGDVEAWRVRNVAAGTRLLSMAHAAEVDVRLSKAGRDGLPVVARMSRSRVDKVIAQYVCVDDDSADETRKRNLEDRHVRFGPGGEGVEEINAIVSAAEGRRLDARVDEIAGWLGEVDAASGAEPRTKDVRRSVALVMLGEPAQVADLEEQVHELRHGKPTDGDDQPSGDDRPCDDDQPRGDDRPTTGEQPTRGDASAFRRPRLSATVLYVHFDASSRSWSLDGHGPITRGEAEEIVGHSQVTIKPVIDLAANISYTGYVAPSRLKEQTALANHGYCTFPHCTSSAWRGEYDHIVDYHARGPTDARNGHRLCKHHHRAKTFGGWTVTSPVTGVWVWRSPRGRFYHVTAGTTTPLELDLFRYAA